MTPEQITSLLKLAADLPAWAEKADRKAGAFAWRVASAIHFHDQESGFAFAELLGIGDSFREAIQTLKKIDEGEQYRATSQPECAA